MLQFKKNGYVSEIKTAKQTNETEEANKKAEQFYNWFKGIGGNLSNFDASELMQKFENETPKINFKNKPDHVKKELNHKFTFNL